MTLVVHPAAKPLVGVVSLPGDKSISHRAALLGAMAVGRSCLINFAPGDDCSRILAALARLGVAVTRCEADGAVFLDSPGWAAWSEPGEPLDMGNSATAMRLLCGALASRHGFFILTGDESLRRRPMRRIVEPLRAMGARIDGRAAASLPPLAVRGVPLRGAEISLKTPSAQVKSCVLLAGLGAQGTTWVSEPYPSRDHTERLLPVAGIQVLHRAAPPSRRDARGRVGVRGPVKAVASLHLSIPGDPSSAAFLAAAACLVPGSTLLLGDVCVNPTRMGFFDLLFRMSDGRAFRGERCNGSMALGGGEPRQDVEVVYPGAPLESARVGEGDVPAMVDELPLLAVLATQAHGTTSVRGAVELRNKESDRLSACAVELARLGARITEYNDGWDIEGPTPLHGGSVSSGGDHRLAMAFAVAALVARGPVTIHDAQAAAVSDPSFFDRLRRLGVEVEEESST